MAEETASAGAPDDAPGGEPSKAELQRRLDETRENISETVEEIKETFSQQFEDVREKYETVKDGIAEVLDWREEFAKNPVVWGAATLSVGVLIGIGLARAFGDEDDEPARGGRGKKSAAGEWAIAAFGGKLYDELSGLGDKVLPAVSDKVKEMFGIDLSAYLHEARARELPPPRPAKKRAAPGKGAAKKGGAKKSAPSRKKAKRAET